MSNKSYEYIGLPLTPAVIAAIIPRIYPHGMLVVRGDIIKDVVSYHKNHGGGISAANVTSQVKKALSNMQKIGQVEQAGVKGAWRMTHNSSESEMEPTGYDAEEEESYDMGEEPSLFDVVHLSGSGKGCVYIYYYPGYFREKEKFPIKIGRSESGYERRIREQLGTSNPEWPVIYRVLYTERPKVLENYLHSALKLLGRHIESAPGGEWFCERPEKVDDLLRAIKYLD